MCIWIFQQCNIPFLIAMDWQLHAHLLTHWGPVTHICVSDLTSIGSDNSLSPGRRQAIIRTNAGILLIRPLGTNFSEFLVEILIFSFMKMRLKVSSAKRRPFCLGLNELIPLQRPILYLIALNKQHPSRIALKWHHLWQQQTIYSSYSYFYGT